MLKNNIKKYKKIFILAGEESGDIIASDLIKEVKNQIKGEYNLKFYGVTGSRMKSEGVHSVLDYSKINYLGFTDVVLNFLQLKLRLHNLIDKILNINPDVLITIDAKMFSLSLAKSLKKSDRFNEFKLIHIVPPTIWAHRPSRANKWKGVFDILVSIIPNEDKFFKKYDINTEYYGNPIFENFLNKLNQLNKINHFIEKNKTTCLILPGSRKNEIYYNLDVLLKTVIKINSSYQEKIIWLLPTLDQFKNHISNEISKYKLQDDISIVDFEKSLEKIMLSKIAISCSGTATLQLSLLAIPTIAIYKTSFLNALIAKLLVNFDNVVLPNFIVGEKVLPFLFQGKCNSENLHKLFCVIYEDYNKYKNKFLKLSMTLKSKIINNKYGFNNLLTKKIIKFLS
mgnify:FL=1